MNEPLSAFLEHTPPQPNKTTVGLEHLAWSGAALSWTTDAGAERHLLTLEDSAQPPVLQLSWTSEPSQPTWLQRLLRRPSRRVIWLHVVLRTARGEKLELCAPNPLPDHLLTDLPHLATRGERTDSDTLLAVLRTAHLLEARVARGATSWQTQGMIDGEERIEPHGLAFADERAPYERLQGWCYIDPAGRVAIPGPFDSANPFQQGRARVSRGDRYGHIDRNGNVIVPLRYHEATDFQFGQAKLATRWRDLTVDLEGARTHSRFKPHVRRSVIFGATALLLLIGLLYYVLSPPSDPGERMVYHLDALVEIGQDETDCTLETEEGLAYIRENADDIRDTFKELSEDLSSDRELALTERIEKMKETYCKSSFDTVIDALSETVTGH